MMTSPSSHPHPHQVREREEALKELHTKLLKAESARSIDSGLLAEMQESVRQLQEQRRQWRESLGGRSVEELRVISMFFTSLVSASTLATVPGGSPRAFNDNEGEKFPGLFGSSLPRIDYGLCPLLRFASPVTCVGFFHAGLRRGDGGAAKAGAEGAA